MISQYWKGKNKNKKNSRYYKYSYEALRCTFLLPAKGVLYVREFTTDQNIRPQVRT